MEDLQIKCLKNVVLEVTRDDGEIDRSTLQTDLVLRKEVGNARLVSGDSVLWVGKGVLCHKDAAIDSTPTRTVRLENNKRRFIFTVALDTNGKQFYSELKDQVDGKAGIEVRKKKRKIRKQLSQLMLDDESTEGTQGPEVHEQKKITSHFFKADAPSSSPNSKTPEKPNALNISMESVVTETEQADDQTTSDDTSGDGTHRSTHGLLNLGNYCYMNAIVQSLSALPVFVKAVKEEENLLKIIRKQAQESVKAMTLEQLKTVFDEWRTSGDTKHLALQYALNQLLQSVIEGSEESINPEPLKNLMGRKNSIFATHFQQDAHEFLLNLVTEYEKELVETVHEVTDKVVKENKSSPQFESEVLELTCEKCKVGKEAESAYQINSLPSVLVFHLKRFEVNPHTGVLFKRASFTISVRVLMRVIMSLMSVMEKVNGSAEMIRTSLRFQKTMH
ncbi:hypothetical protein BBJ29_002016 [Phytophthora kernoviae]|uniref:USP domain-containing protein n=1 Tax=Phytophthora kernoviae TaxID=325452 RepID=A0A3F2S433_9STRA|nr:hypothetical protein BBJ29_002016 [Phytophthora kernoviae]RLN69954.1 hypothetical protein BBP00_00000035 [Phytophthora kernoviae]